MGGWGSGNIEVTGKGIIRGAGAVDGDGAVAVAIAHLCRRPIARSHNADVDAAVKAMGNGSGTV